MSNLVKAIQDFESRNIHVLFAHRCRAKTNAGIARLLNSKYLDCPSDDEKYSEYDIPELIRAGFLEQRDGYIYVLGWF